MSEFESLILHQDFKIELALANISLFFFSLGNWLDRSKIITLFQMPLD